MIKEKIINFLKFKKIKNKIFDNFNIWFTNFLFDIYEERPFIEWLLCSLCEVEMEFKAVNNEKFRKYLNFADICHVNVNDVQESDAVRDIPKDTFYCDGCPFHSYSKLAKNIFGYQSSGYCYYLRKGDFSFIRPTDLLWDGCKCCGVNDDID